MWFEVNEIVAKTEGVDNFSIDKQIGHTDKTNNHLLPMFCNDISTACSYFLSYKNSTVLLNF